MALVKPLPPDANEEVKKLARFFNETLGFCPNSVLTMQHRPEIAKSFIALNIAVMENHGRVSSSLKRLIGYVVSNVAGCRYCQAHTIRAAQRYGTPSEQMKNIWEFRTHSAFNDAERAALEFSVASASTPNGVHKEIQEHLHKHWDDGEIVEILGVISLFGYLNRWNDSMGTTLEERAEESAQQWLTNAGWERGKHL